jgi:hypothetical protein
MTTDDPMLRYTEVVRSVTDQHHTRQFEYEKEALGFAQNAFRVLTYMNGGALVAIPTAVALFGADVKAAKLQLIIAAGFFVGGLLFVVLAQAGAFFTMARRSEAERDFMYEQMLLTQVALGRSDDPQFREKKTAAARERRTQADRRLETSDIYRFVGLMCFWISFVLFVVGCIFGGQAVLAGP